MRIERHIQSIVLALILFLNFLFLLDVCVAGEQFPPKASIWSHNGSAVKINSIGPTIEIVYDEPREGLQTEGVTKGTLLFKGAKLVGSDAISGVAFIFSSKCGPVPYSVAGIINGKTKQIKLEGNAPKLKKASCTIIGKINDRLLFNYTTNTELNPSGQPNQTDTGKTEIQDDIYYYVQNKDWQLAKDLLLPMAKSDAWGQTMLGWMHEKGLGFEIDIEEAVRLYSIAAMTGFPTAQFNLGFLYESGFGVKKNDLTAINWYLKAADQGDKEALQRLRNSQFLLQEVPALTICSGAISADLLTLKNDHELPYVREAISRGYTVNSCRQVLGLAPLTSQANSDYESPASDLPACKGDYRHNCQGTLTLADGSKYVGEFKDNEPNGQVTLTMADGDKYIGEWINRPHGQGTYTWANGNKYVGEWWEGLENGQGTYTYANGDKYVGQFRDIGYNGQGTFTFASGDEHVGIWGDGKRNGLFTVSYMTGDTFSGNYISDQRKGPGTYTWKDGSKYVGQWSEGVPTRNGLHASASGSVLKDVKYKSSATYYHGRLMSADALTYEASAAEEPITTWHLCSTALNNLKNNWDPASEVKVQEAKRRGLSVDDCRLAHGLAPLTTTHASNLPKCTGDYWHRCQGTLIFANGTEYVGEWDYGKRNGSFTVSYANGDTFSGNYVISDKRQGHGTYLWNDGSKYVGQWADGVPTVDGLHASASGTVLREVKYTNTATYTDGGYLKSADVLAYEAPAVVAQQTVQQPTQSTEPISPTNVDTGKRVALVIGNGSYKNVPVLPNPSNDAEAMAAMLSGMGFDVVKGVDLDRSGMEKLIGTFAEKASDAKVSLFFYAGHAIQVDGKNYLMPIDAALKTATSVEFELLEVEQKIVRFMGGETAIILLDSCRDNPLKKEFAQVARSAKVSRGLAQLSIDAGQQLIGFATSPGEVAEDGEGKNSPFTTALLKFLPTPGLEIEQAMKRVKNEVYEATGKKQMPWHNSAMRQDFFFVPAGASGTDTVITQTQPSQSATDPAAQAWGIIQNTTSVAVLEDFVRQFSTTVYGSLAKARLEELKQSQVGNGG